MDPSEVTTPEEFAKRMGWSAKHVRRLAKKLGACHVLGNRMRLTKEDVDAILEATKQTPVLPPPKLRDLFDRPQSQRLPDVTSEEVMKMLEGLKRERKVAKRRSGERQRKS